MVRRRGIERRRGSVQARLLGAEAHNMAAAEEQACVARLEEDVQRLCKVHMVPALGQVAGKLILSTCGSKFEILSVCLSWLVNRL